MKGFNSPGRYSRSAGSLKRNVQDETSLPGVSFGFLTEVADPDRAAAIPKGAGPGWTVTQGQGPGKAECAILTKDKLRGPVIFQDLIKLSEGGGKGRLHNPIYAPVVITKAPSGRKTLFTTAHLPAHIERLFRIALFMLPTRTKMRLLLKSKLSPALRTYVEGVLTWKHEVMQLAAEHHVDDIVVGADWNLNAFLKWVRELFGNFWPGLTLASSKGPDLGHRNVGWLLTSMEMVSSSVHKDPASDHLVGRFELKHLNSDPVDPTPKIPPPPFELVTYNGARMDQSTKVRVQMMELILGYALTIYQGCYNPGGVSASGGTHDKGGVLDFAPFDFAHKIHVWRTHFGPAWHRLKIIGLWGEHIHVVSENHGNLAPTAQLQVVEYHNGEDGLVGHHQDPNQYHPEVDFSYVAEWRKLNPAA